MSVVKLERPDTIAEPLSRAPGAPACKAAWHAILLVGFDQGGDSARYREIGWSGQEKDFVWAVGDTSALRLPGLPPHETALLVDADIRPFSFPPLLHMQIVQVYANGSCLGSAFVRGLSRLRFRLEAAMFAPGEPVVIEFRHPCYAKPRPLREIADDRLLSVQFLSVRVYSAALLDRIDAFLGLPAGMSLCELSPPIRPATLRPAHAGARHVHPVTIDGGSAPILRDGWMIVGEEGFAWTAARVSRIDLPVPDDAGPYRMQISLAPLLIRSVVGRQRLALFCQGAALGQFVVASNTVLSVPLPPELLAGRTSIPIDILTPDAISLSDFSNATSTQRLGFAVDQVSVEGMPPQLEAWAAIRGDELESPSALAVSQRFLDETLDELPDAVAAATGKKLTDLLRVFESIGDNCGFGLAQRKGGVEVLGLLRFANTPLKHLLRGLEDEFKAVTQPRNMEVYLHEEGVPREYMLRIQRYGIRWHTMVHEPDAEAEAVFGQQSMKLGYLHRKFYEGLRASRKIYVLSRSEPVKIDMVMPAWKQRRRYEQEPEPLKLAEAMTVAMALNRYGRNTLLYIVPCKAGHRSGTVELLAPGIMRAHIEKFAISNDVAIRDHADWLRIVANAWMLDQGPNAAFRKGSGVAAA